MKIQRSRVTAFIGLLALLSASIHLPTHAQEKREPKKPDYAIALESTPFLGAGANQDLPVEGAATIKFLEAKFAFDKLVKGAAYSAVAVTETTQTLSDGNQITRKSEVILYRDSEGRTRREQTLEGVKTWQAAGDPPRMIFINDPIAGYNYVLDPRARTARKTMGPGKGKPGEPIYNEREKTIEKLEAAGQKMARKQGPTETGEKPLYKTGKPGEKTPWITSFVKGTLSNSLTGISADTSIQEGIVNIDEVLSAIVRPDYDEAAKTAGAQGSVRIRFIVDETGRVESMNAEEGNAPFLERALAGAKQIRFRPLVRDGKALRNQGTITFRFTLLPAQSEAAESDAKMARPVKPAPAEGGRKMIAHTVESENALRQSLPEAGPVKRAPAEGPTVPRPVKPEISIGTRKTESLGKQTIEGIEAEGTRSTLTIAAGEIGNRLPIEITDERWYSAELQTMLMSKHHDPRSGDTIYRLTNINRGEPDRSLFEVPLDYTLNDATKPSPARIKKSEDER